MLLAGFFLLLFATIAELWSIIQVAHLIGGWPTFWLLVVQGVVGAWIIKLEGIASIRRSLEKIVQDMEGHGIPAGGPLARRLFS